MADGEDKTKSRDFYQVLELNKECTASELRNAYKKLALRWHPDRCSSSGNSKLEEEAKENFQAIQKAYSVLSDANKRFLYDAGAYDSDDEENGMVDFLNEMAIMMSQTKSSNENGQESFKELQELFEEMFENNMESFEVSCQFTATPSTSCFASNGESCGSKSNTNSSEMSCEVDDSSGLTHHFQKCCLGVEHQQSFKKGKGGRGGGIQGGAKSGRRKQGRKQNVSSGVDVSS